MSKKTFSALFLIISLSSISCLAQNTVLNMAAYRPKVTRQDSILLFQTIANGFSSNPTEVVKNKGHIPYLSINNKRQMQIGVWKQHGGYFTFSGKIKDLNRGYKYLPGHTEISYDPATGFKHESSVIFDLNSGINQPIEYVLEDQGSTKKEPKILSDSKTGTNYNQYLASHTTTMGLPGHVTEVGIGAVALLRCTTNFQYLPFSGTFGNAKDDCKEIYKISTQDIKGDQWTPTLTSYANKTYTTIGWDGNKPMVITVDWNGKNVKKEPIAEASGMTILVQKEMFSDEIASDWINVDSAKTVGMALVFGVKNKYGKIEDGSFVHVTIDNDGGMVVLCFN